MTTPPADELLQHLDWVRSLAARLVFDGSHRDDLAQEIWHAALRGSRPGSVPLRAWLTGIGKHLAAMVRRRDGRRRRREAAAAPTGEARSAADLAEHAELQQRLLGAVSALPQPMRDVVLLRFLEGLPPRRIARQLAIPVATVRTRLQRALARLREDLDADFGDRRAWALAMLALPRPRHVAAATGAFVTITHLGLAVMNANKLFLAAAALLVLAAIPTAIALSSPRYPAPPDYGESTPVAAIFTRPTADEPSAGTPPSSRQTAAAPVPSLRGRVVDQHGAPVAGVVLRRFPTWQFEALLAAGTAHLGDASTESDADGTFELVHLGPSKNGCRLQAEHPDYVPEQATSSLRLDAPATIVMMRTHEVELVVEVVERTSRTPVPRFRVTGTTTWRTGEEGKDGAPRGRFASPENALGENGRFHGKARFVAGRPFEVLVHCSGHGRGMWNDGTDPIPARTLEPMPGQDLHVMLEVDFDQAERLADRVQRGRIVDAGTGAPLPGAEVVTVTRGERSVSYLRRVQSRADGTFAVALPRDGAACTLLVEHDDYQTLHDTPDPGEERLYRLLPRASLRVRLVDAAGLPLPGAHVLVVARHDASFHERRRTDERGEFVLTRLLEGRYSVFVVPHSGAPDEQAIANASYAVEPGQQRTATLAIEPPEALRVVGTLLGGPDGLAPAFVPFAGEGRWTRGRMQGRHYDAGGLQRGNYLVLLFAANDDDRHLPTILLPTVHVQGLGDLAIDLLVPTGIVRGRLVSSRPTVEGLRVLVVPTVPAGGLAAELLASPKFAQAIAVPARADGSFEVQHIADGTSELQVRDGATVLARRPIRVRGSLDIGDWSIDG